MNKLITIVVLSVFAVSMMTAQIKVIAPNGDVGIGVDSPTEKLDVDGNAKVRGNVLSVGTDITGGAAFVKVGVGRPAPGAAAFDFVSNLAYPAFGLRLLRDANGTSRFSHRGANPLMFATNDMAAMQFLTNNTIRMTIQNDGQVDINGSATVNGGVSVTSDKRLKKGISNYKKGLEEVLKINPKVYSYTGEARTSTTREYIGVLAQDLEEIVPEFVSTHTYQEYSDNGEIVSEKDYLKVHDSELKYLMINAIKDQQRIIDVQDQKITALEEKINQIMTNIGADNGSIDVSIESKNIALIQSDPNPFTEFTTVKFNMISDNEGDASLVVTNATGEVVKTMPLTERKGEVKIELNGMPNGVYIVSYLFNGQRLDSSKVIKQ